MKVSFVVISALSILGSAVVFDRGMIRLSDALLWFAATMFACAVVME